MNDDHKLLCTRHLGCGDRCFNQCKAAFFAGTEFDPPETSNSSKKTVANFLRLRLVFRGIERRNIECPKLIGGILVPVQRARAIICIMNMGDSSIS
jgi:hypothetical protein